MNRVLPRSLSLLGWHRIDGVDLSREYLVWNFLVHTNLAEEANNTKNNHDNHMQVLYKHRNKITEQVLQC